MVPLGLPSARPMAQALRLPFEKREINHTSKNIQLENPEFFSKDMNICAKLYHPLAHNKYSNGNGANHKLKSLPLVDELQW